MQITLKLYATLGDYLPPGAVRNSIAIQVAADESINSILQRHNVPIKMAHLVLVNGHFIAPDRRTEHTLVEGDELAVWPPIAGG